MEVRWVVKTTPEVKKRLTVAANLLWEGDTSSRVAARLLAEVFDIKLKEENA